MHVRSMPKPPLFYYPAKAPNATATAVGTLRLGCVLSKRIVGRVISIVVARKHVKRLTTAWAEGGDEERRHASASKSFVLYQQFTDKGPNQAHEHTQGHAHVPEASHKPTNHQGAPLAPLPVPEVIHQAKSSHVHRGDTLPPRQILFFHLTLTAPEPTRRGRHTPDVTECKTVCVSVSELPNPNHSRRARCHGPCFHG